MYTTLHSSWTMPMTSFCIFGFFSSSSSKWNYIEQNKIDSFQQHKQVDGKISSLKPFSSSQMSCTLPYLWVLQCCLATGDSSSGLAFSYWPATFVTLFTESEIAIFKKMFFLLYLHVCAYGNERDILNYLYHICHYGSTNF